MQNIILYSKHKYKTTLVKNKYRQYLTKLYIKWNNIANRKVVKSFTIGQHLNLVPNKKNSQKH